MIPIQAKSEEEFSQTRAVASSTKSLSWVVIIFVNAFSVYYSVLNGFQRGLQWQKSYLIACIVQFVSEITINETMVTQHLPLQKLHLNRFRWTGVCVDQLLDPKLCFHRSSGSCAHAGEHYREIVLGPRDIKGSDEKYFECSRSPFRVHKCCQGLSANK